MRTLQFENLTIVAVGESIYIYIWPSGALGAAVYQWCEFKSCRGENKICQFKRSHSNTVGFNFNKYIYI